MTQIAKLLSTELVYICADATAAQTHTLVFRTYTENILTLISGQIVTPIRGQYG